MSDIEKVIDEAHDLLQAAADELAASGARDEALAELVTGRKILMLERPATFQPLGRVWRLGALLLRREGGLFATGSITRAVEPGYPGHISVSVELRKAYRGMALKAGYPDGETINFAASRIELEASITESTGPVVVRNGALGVLWSPQNPTTTPFATYLSDRVELLVNPPEGA